MRRALSLLTFALLLTPSAASPASSPAGSAGSFDDRMAAEHLGDAPTPSPAAQAEPAAAVEGREVSYASIEGEAVNGYLATPAAAPAGTAGGNPGIILIHEWWGLNDNIRAVARRLAGEGYTALAVDLYQGQVAADPGQARELTGQVGENRDRALDNLRQARAFLAEKQGAAKVGVVGWCFGGGWSLQTALALGDEIDAAVIYYGRLETDAEALKPLRAPVLGLFGSEDRGIPVESVKAFEAALRELGKAAEIHVYEGANHAFANPSGQRYHEEAAEDAWEKTKAFFARHLKG